MNAMPFLCVFFIVFDTYEETQMAYMISGTRNESADNFVFIITTDSRLAKNTDARGFDVTVINIINSVHFQNASLKQNIYIKLHVVYSHRVFVASFAFSRRQSVKNHSFITANITHRHSIKV